ncbi:unnamed protein product [Polarella glacialis]|uniref:Uncharacterized protein n=1 Tax=Polarella glacialis TaxID=89957 RepID=A0A813GBZ6_POLGL|nr:unnamed protein product [Polarella glacialis]
MAVQGFEHLQWLNPKDRQVLCRGECAAALKEESKLLAEIRQTIVSHQRAIEHCRAVSETDPTWFSLDVQDNHARHVTILRNMLRVLEQDAAPAPENAGIVDSLRGRLLSSYAQTAEATSRAAASEQVQAATASARSALGSLSAALTSSFPSATNEAGLPASPGGQHQATSFDLHASSSDLHRADEPSVVGTLLSSSSTEPHAALGGQESLFGGSRPEPAAQRVQIVEAMLERPSESAAQVAAENQDFPEAVDATSLPTS